MSVVENQNEISNGNIFQICTFNIGDALCGININNVQEISKDLDMTEVPLAPAYILGIKNLRGGIVTVIDLGEKLGLGSSKVSPDTRIIIVDWHEEFIGLLVDNISNILTANLDNIEDSPSNVKGMQDKYFEGVVNTEIGLVALMKIDKVLEKED